VICVLGPKVHAYIAKSGCSPDEADQLFWDVIAELVPCEHALRRTADLWSYVLPIIRRCSARARRTSRHEVPAEQSEFVAPDPAVSRRSEARAALLHTWARTVLSLLSPRQRQSVQLHIVERRSYCEAASLMCSTEGAVRKNVHAGIKRLRSISESYPPHRMGTEVT
jgi:RNA polymerase sigma factor (sigma-70 family)